MLFLFHVMDYRPSCDTPIKLAEAAERSLAEYVLVRLKPISPLNFRTSLGIL